VDGKFLNLMIMMMTERNVCTELCTHEWSALCLTFSKYVVYTLNRNGMMTEICPLIFYPFYWIYATARAALEGENGRRGG
jgi:hypothetical protein